MRLKKSLANYEELTLNGNKKADCFIGTLDKTKQIILHRDSTKVAKLDNIYCKFLCDMCFCEFILKPLEVTKEQKWCNNDHNTKSQKNLLEYLEKNTENSDFFIGLQKEKIIKVMDPTIIKITDLKSKLVFQCSQCLHVYYNTFYDFLKNQGCTYCKNPSLLCDSETCKMCFKRSFDSYEDKTRLNKTKKDFLKGYYSQGIFIKETNPRNISINLNLKLVFYCDICKKDFQRSLFKVTQKNKWCQDCMHLTETILYSWLKENFKNEKIIREYSESWTKNKKYDYCFPDWKLLIELDGPHHFIKVHNGKCPLKAQENDRKKDSIAINNGYSIIRVCQQDVIKNRNKWEHYLKYAILLFKNSKFTQRIMLYNLKNQLYNNPLYHHDTKENNIT